LLNKQKNKGDQGITIMTTAIIGGGLASCDEVLVYFEAAARRFGIKIEETIIEK